jgi:nitroreductase
MSSKSLSFSRKSRNFALMMIENFSTPVTEVQNSHVSVRKFSNKPLDAGMLDTILETARRSPTSSNRQTYSIVVVRDLETRKQLAVLAGNQQHIVECQAFVAFCADTARIEIACEMHGVALKKGLELTLVSTIDAALVGMSAQTAAESFGLGAVMIGGMRNHPQEAADLLGLPSGAYIVYGMSIGWPKETNNSTLKPRLPRELVIHYEKYDTQDPREKMAAYDRELADFYGTRNQADAAWTAPIAKQLQHQSRPHLRKTLEEMGFRFE